MNELRPIAVQPSVRTRSPTATKGFTLIELLVVIAIIGILAAMLFPVFARARESARKTQCLSNVKNIALAYQMYLADYDRFPPTEHRQEVTDWFAARGGGHCWMITNQPNPYLRIPVILDEYVKNRDVWACPSGPIVNNFGINSCLPDWWTKFLNSPDFWCRPLICTSPYPPGWGGNVTDTTTQHQCGGGGEVVGGRSSTTGSFKTNYASPAGNRDKPTGAMEDAAKWLVVGDSGVYAEGNYPFTYAYPDFCRIACAGVGCVADWTNCPATRACGAGTPDFQTDPERRKTYARPRHMGGSNLGFADGHVKWFAAEAIMFGGTAGPYHEAGDLFDNLQNCMLPPTDIPM
jgi:prepilin-type N-terminal cleavage/methylation domain-containing protein/prepilin-type processing-associated H-X9-DG protein